MLFLEDIMSPATLSAKAIGSFYLFRPSSFMRLTGRDTVQTVVDNLKSKSVTPPGFVGVLVDLGSGKLGLLNAERIEALVLSGTFTYGMPLDQACVPLPIAEASEALSQSLSPPVGVQDQGVLVGVLSCYKKIVTPGGGATTYTCG